MVELFYPIHSLYIRSLYGTELNTKDYFGLYYNGYFTYYPQVTQSRSL